MDTYDYQRLLVVKAMENRYLPIANSFAADNKRRCQEYRGSGVDFVSVIASHTMPEDDIGICTQSIEIAPSQITVPNRT